MAVGAAEAHNRKPVAVNGTVRSHSPAGVKLNAGSGYVFAATITVPYNGCILTFEAGPAYQIDATLLAYLASNSINPTAL